MRVYRKLFIILAIGLTTLSSFAEDKNSYVKSLYSLPLSLDPIQMNDGSSLVVGNLIYDGLLKFSPSLKLVPAIAESWTSSKDGKVLTFHIRKNAKFHDGNPITAHDAVESLKRALSPGSKVRKYYDCILGFDDISKVNNGPYWV